MPVRNKAATAAAMVWAVLIPLTTAATGALADSQKAVSVTTVPSTDAVGTSPVTVSPDAATTVTTAGSDVETAATTASASTPPDSITLGMLEQVQQENLLLAAKVQTAQLQRQLAEAGIEASASTGTGAAPQPGATQPSSSVVPGIPGPQEGRASSRSPVVPRPQVLEISGKGNVLRALLQMPDGSQPEVSTGSRVVIGKAALTVSRISLAGITLSDGSELSF